MKGTWGESGGSSTQLPEPLPVASCAVRCPSRRRVGGTRVKGPDQASGWRLVEARTRSQAPGQKQVFSMEHDARARVFSSGRGGDPPEGTFPDPTRPCPPAGLSQVSSGPVSAQPSAAVSFSEERERYRCPQTSRGWGSCAPEPLEPAAARSHHV